MLTLTLMGMFPRFADARKEPFANYRRILLNSAHDIVTFVLPIIVAFVQYELAMTMHFCFAGSICVLLIYNRMTRSNQPILTKWLYLNGSNTHTRLY